MADYDPEYMEQAKRYVSYSQLSQAERKKTEEYDKEASSLRKMKKQAPGELAAVDKLRAMADERAQWADQNRHKVLVDEIYRRGLAKALRK